MTYNARGRPASCVYCQLPGRFWQHALDFGRHRRQHLLTEGRSKEDEERALTISAQLWYEQKALPLMQSQRGSQSLPTSPSLGTWAHIALLPFRIQLAVTNAWTACRHYQAVFTPNNLNCVISECSINWPQWGAVMPCWIFNEYWGSLRTGFQMRLYFHTIQPGTIPFLRGDQ